MIPIGHFPRMRFGQGKMALEATIHSILAAARGNSARPRRRAAVTGRSTVSTWYPLIGSRERVDGVTMRTLPGSHAQAPIRAVPSLAIAAGLLFAACASLTPEGERIRLVGSPSAIAGCRYIGRFTARVRSTKPGSSLTGNFAIARANAKTEVRNDAGRAGADTLLSLRTEDDFWGVDAWAEAYACRSRGPASPGQ
jgi:hypothetical protein